VKLSTRPINKKRREKTAGLARVRDRREADDQRAGRRENPSSICRSLAATRRIVPWRRALF
jgi:hypothetical protein